MEALLEPERRPRSISVIGWITLVFSCLLSAKALIDLAVWSAMGPALPRLLRIASDPSADIPYVRAILAHLTEIKLAQAVIWAGVAVTAIALLRLRPWARVAMQVVGFGILVYCAGIFAVWAWAWTLPADPTAPQLSHASRLTLIVSGMTVIAALAAIVVSMIVVLRRPRIRQAFESAAR